jgi:hypothetical protein
MSPDKQRAVDPEPRARRPYAAPKLRKLGDVVTMTRMPKTIGVTESGTKACTGTPSSC